jgi:hypothetical protein
MTDQSSSHRGTGLLLIAASLVIVVCKEANSVS